MADAPAPKAPAGGGKGTFGFLTRKIGPAPVWVYAVVIAAAYYWYTHYGPGAKTAAAAASSAGGSAIDPVTGEPYSEELGAAEQQLDSGAGNGSGTAAGGAASTYTTNEQWATAAVNYLVGLGIDPTVASQAVENYLSSQTNTTAQQADVNTAIEGIGPPPQIPGPASTSPAPVSGGGSGGGAGGGTGGGPTTGGSPPAPAAGTVSVPDVRNLQVNDGIAKITAAGLSYKLSSERNPADTYVINSQTPAPGAKVAKGSTVDLGIAPKTFAGE